MEIQNVYPYQSVLVLVFDEFCASAGMFVICLLLMQVLLVLLLKTSTFLTPLSPSFLIIVSIPSEKSNCLLFKVTGFQFW